MSAETASGPTQDQVEILEYNFNKVNKHPDPTTLCLIAAEAGLSEEETQVSPARTPRAPTPAPGTAAPTLAGAASPMWRSHSPSPAASRCPLRIVHRFCLHSGTLHRSLRCTPASGLHGCPVCPPCPVRGGSPKSCVETSRSFFLLLVFPLSATVQGKRCLLPPG